MAAPSEFGYGRAGYPLDSLMRATGELPEGVDYLLSKPCTLNGLRKAVAKVTKA